MAPQKQFYDLVRSVAEEDQKFKELALLKADTIKETISVEFESVLAYGFSMVAYGMALQGHKVYLTNCCEECVKATPGDIIHVSESIEDLAYSGKKYDLVLAVDQATTYVDSNYNQQKLIRNLSMVTRKQLVTTLVDFKNMRPHEKMFDEPFYLKYNGSKERTFLNHRKWDPEDRQAWLNYLYVIDENHEMTVIGPTQRRTMYFKQLAKFLHDNNVKDFKVHKTPMYKSIFSKTFEYIITAEF